MKYLIPLAMLTLVSAPAFAAFEGPSAVEKVTTVKEALSITASDDAKFCMEGNIINKLPTSSEKYTFRDGSGEIMVEIDDKIIANVHVTPANRVRICGELDKEYLKGNEFDVKSMQILQ